MKILVLYPHPYFQDRRISIALRTLLEALVAEGHSPTCLLYRAGEDLYVPGCRLLRTPKLPLIGRMLPFFFWKRPLYKLMMTRMADRLLEREQFDLLLCFAGGGVLSRYLSRRRKIPYILYLDREIGERLPLSSLLQPLLTRLERSLLNHSSGVLVSDGLLAAQIEQQSRGAMIQPIEQPPLPSRAAAGSQRKKTSLGDPRGALTLLYAGPLSSSGGVDLLLEAFSLAYLDKEKLRLVIIGGTRRQIAGYRRKARALGVVDGVLFVGKKPVSELPEYLAQADLLISPCTAADRPPLELSSYLDSGRPLIATRLPMHTQVLDDSIAMLVEPVDSEMALAILQLAESADRRVALAAQAKTKAAEQFGIDAYHRKLRSFFLKLRPHLEEAARA